MKTLAVRLQAIEKTALALAGWLAARPEVELVIASVAAFVPGP